MENLLFLTRKLPHYIMMPMRFRYRNCASRPSIRPIKERSIMNQNASPRKPISRTAWLFIAMAGAILLGLLSLLLPAHQRQAFSQSILSPINDTFMGLLSAIAGPVIFLSILCSIASMGSMDTLGKIGKKTILRILLVPLLLSFLIMMIMLPFYGVENGESGAPDGDGIFQMILDIVPDNLFTPFTESNFLQIIFVAVLLGAALLMLGRRVSSVSEIALQCRIVINKILDWITSLMPIFVFGVLLNLMMSSSQETMLSYYKVILMCMLSFVVLVSLYLIRVSIHKKVSLWLLLKKMLPTFIIAITTASSTAALPTNMRDCEKRLGIKKQLVDFAAPLGQIVFKPGAMTAFWAIALHTAVIYGIPITPSWLVTALMMVYILGAATPPIAGGLILSFNIFFTHLGIPLEALGIAAALNAILTFFCTAVNIACFQCEAVELAGSLNMLDMDTLRKPTAPEPAQSNETI